MPFQTDTHTDPKAFHGALAVALAAHCASRAERADPQTYLRELLSEVKRATGHTIDRITLTSPVDAYEGYRAELRRMFESFGVRVARFVDEPVAAAVGYGISVRDTRYVPAPRSRKA